MKVFFHTLGCKVNQYETAALAEIFAREGFETCEREDDADVCVVNSCTVTEAGDKKSVRGLRRAKKDGSPRVTVLCGCFAQAFPEKAAQIAQADIVAGTKNRAELPHLVREFLENGERIVAIEGYTPVDSFESLPVTDMKKNTRAFLKIEDGCERFCTYCVVPYARGPVRSMPLDELRAQARTLAECGHREIVLTGINLCFYGREFGLTLADAVEAACAVPEVVRVRLSSVEPDMLTPEILARLSAQPKLCAHFHMSLQSGCDATLARMGRKYTTADYVATANTIRTLFASPSFTTDIIVGFPGESDEEFAQTVEFVNNFGFLKCHIFPYSRRSGTPAAEFPDQIDEGIKKARAMTLGLAAEKTRAELIAAQVGKCHTAIAETRLARNVFDGFTEGYFPCVIKRAGLARAEVVTGTATRVEDGKLVIE